MSKKILVVSDTKVPSNWNKFVKAFHTYLNRNVKMKDHNITLVDKSVDITTRDAIIIDLDANTLPLDKEFFDNLSRQVELSDISLFDIEYKIRYIYGKGYVYNFTINEHPFNLFKYGKPVAFHLHNTKEEAELKAKEMLTRSYNKSLSTKRLVEESIKNELELIKQLEELGNEYRGIIDI